MLYDTNNPTHQMRRAMVLPMMAICLTALIGVLAIALEGGLRLNNHQRVQAAADAAALDAAAELFRNYPRISSANPDPNGAAQQKARDSVARNLPGEPYTVTVNIPPANGPAMGELGCVEVLVRYAQPRYFSRIYGVSTLPISARAVARGQWSETRNGIIVLDPHQSEALKVNGTVNMTVKNANVINNSDNSQATGGDGQGSVIHVVGAEFYLTGGIKANSTLIGPINLRHPPIPDPLAYLPEPSLPTSVNKAGPPKRGDDPSVAKYLDPLGLPRDRSKQVWVLEPGRYDNLPNFTNQDIVILRQASANGAGGIYYLNNSGFQTLGASVVMDPTGETTGGVMFYTAPTQTGRGIEISGGSGAIVKISPLKQGPYRGITLFQKRSVADVPLSITGQGNMTMTGTFYTAGSAINVNGNDSTGLNVLGSQYISRTLSVGGNGKFYVQWEDDTTGRTRSIGFVE